MIKSTIMMVTQSVTLKKIKMRSKQNPIITKIITTTIVQEAEEEVSIDRMMLTNIENLRRVTQKIIRMITLEAEVEEEVELEVEVEAETISIENENKNRLLKKSLYLSIKGLLSKTHKRRKNISKTRSQDKNKIKRQRKLRRTLGSFKLLFSN